MSINKTFSILFLILVVFAVFSLSFYKAFNDHLRVDFWGQYMSHANHFINDWNLSNIEYNEYQPVAVMFFSFAGLSMKIFDDRIFGYVLTIYLANLLLAFLSAFLIYRYSKNYTNVFLFSLVILFSGPIVMHRFELLVFVFLASGFLFLKREKYFWGGIMMGIAILTKIYPIVFAPYLLYLALKSEKKSVNTIKLIAGYAVGALLVLFIYVVLLKADFYKIYSDLSIHSIKPVHAESIWAGFLVLYHWVANGVHHIGGGSNGIFGIKDQFIILPKIFYNYFWVLAVLAFQVFYIVKTMSRKAVNFNIKIVYIALLIFLLSSKILTAQYLLWFALPFCLQLIPNDKKKEKSWSMALFFILLSLVLSELIYPLGYTSFENFLTSGSSSAIFWVFIARNTVLIILLIKVLADLFKEIREQPALEN